jgi:hypothetical protein
MRLSETLPTSLDCKIHSFCFFHIVIDKCLKCSGCANYINKNCINFLLTGCVVAFLILLLLVTMAVCRLHAKRGWSWRYGLAQVTICYFIVIVIQNLYNLETAVLLRLSVPRQNIA